MSIIFWFFVVVNSNVFLGVNWDIFFGGGLMFELDISCVILGVFGLSDIDIGYLCYVFEIFIDVNLVFIFVVILFVVLRLGFGLRGDFNMLVEEMFIFLFIVGDIFGEDYIFVR